MTLKEKFDVISCKDCDMPFCDNKCTMLSDWELNKLEQIADDYAIGFLEWYFSDDGNNLIHDLILVGELDKNTSTQELLEIFKKEKGLCD